MKALPLVAVSPSGSVTSPIEIVVARTVSGAAPLVEPRKLPSPPYAAESECGPGSSTTVASASPPEPKAAVATTTRPSLKITEPVGVPAAGATTPTVALSLTGVP